MDRSLGQDDQEETAVNDRLPPASRPGRKVDEKQPGVKVEKGQPGLQQQAGWGVDRGEGHEEQRRSDEWKRTFVEGLELGPRIEAECRGCG